MNHNLLIVLFLLFQFISEVIPQVRKPRVRRLDQFELEEEDDGSGDYASKKSLICDYQLDNNYKLQAQSFVRRYVNTFLRYSKLHNTDLQDRHKNDYVTTTLNIRIKVQHLEELQKYFNGEKEYLSLADLDIYLTDVMYMSKMEEIGNYSTNIAAFILKLLPDVTAFQLALFTAFIIFIYLWYKHSFKMALPSLFICVVVESFQKYCVLLREEQIKQYLRMKEREAYPVECDPTKKTLFSIVWSTFFEDPCVALYRDMESHHSEHVSFIECLLNNVLVLFIEVPSVRIGEVVSTIAGSIGGKFSWVLAPFINIFLLGMVGVGILILCGFKFKGSSFFGGFEIGGANNTTQISNRNSEFPVNAPAIQQLPSVINININQGSRKRKPSEKLIEGAKPSVSIDGVLVEGTTKPPLKALEGTENPNMISKAVKESESQTVMLPSVVSSESSETEETNKSETLSTENSNSPTNSTDGDQLLDNADSSHSDIDVIGEVESLRLNLKSLCEEDDFDLDFD